MNRVFEGLDFKQKIAVIRLLPKDIQDELIAVLKIRGTLLSFLCIELIQFKP